MLWDVVKKPVHIIVALSKEHFVDFVMNSSTWYKITFSSLIIPRISELLPLHHFRKEKKFEPG